MSKSTHPRSIGGKRELREYLFSYRWNGAEYSLTVSAYSEAEARGRVSQMSISRFDGVVHSKIKIPLGGFLSRLFSRFAERNPQ